MVFENKAFGPILRPDHYFMDTQRKMIVKTQGGFEDKREGILKGKLPTKVISYELKAFENKVTESRKGSKRKKICSKT